jgi:hypothetical protein
MARAAASFRARALAVFAAAAAVGLAALFCARGEKPGRVIAFSWISLRTRTSLACARDRMSGGASPPLYSTDATLMRRQMAVFLANG